MLISTKEMIKHGKSFHKTSTDMNRREMVSADKTLLKPRRIENIDLESRRVSSFAKTQRNRYGASSLEKVGLGEESRQKQSRYRESRSGYLPTQSKMTKTHYTTNRIKHKTQRQKFISQLKSRVLMSPEQMTIEQNQSPQIIKTFSNRFHQIRTNKTAERVKSSSSMIELDVQATSNKYTEQVHTPLVKSKNQLNLENQEDSLRFRSKTFVRDFSKIVQENLGLKRQNTNLDHSKTIELNDIETKLKLSQSLDEIQLMQTAKKSPGHTGAHLNSFQLEKSIDKSISRSLERPQGSQERSNKNLTGRSQEEVDYQKGIEDATKDFFNEWDKMQLTKSILYDKLRNKLVKEYPSMKNRYKDGQITDQTPLRIKVKRSISNYDSLPRSSMRMTHLHSQPSQFNNLTHTQIRNVATKQEQNKEKKFLKDIFKQAYIYCQSKGRHFNEKYKGDEHSFEKKQVGVNQKNLTFLSYMNKRSNRKIINRGKIKGTQLFKNKESILQLEREGSPQQGRLKRCLDDAIQSCVRDNN